MRIGVDLLAMQSPTGRGQCVGRYVQTLLGAMIRMASHHEFILYRHENLPYNDNLPDTPIVPLLYGPGLPDPDPRAALNRVVAENLHRLDVFLTLNPFDNLPRYEPPAPLVGGPAMACVVHDLVPLIFPDLYLKTDDHSKPYYNKTISLKRYDLILTNSECTRRDVARFLGVPDARVVRIGGAVDQERYWPESRGTLDATTRQVLNRLGIRSDFILCIAGGDEHKNVRELIDSFALLPAHLRETHQLVVASPMPGEVVESYHHRARLRGVDDRLLLAGEIDADALRTLYQRCAVFACPSRYEGLGLPLLEALQCGAPVVAGDNSAQRETIGDAGLLAPADEPDAFSKAIIRVLEDAPLNASLRDRGPKQAARFNREDAAQLALNALDNLARRRRPSRPRLAVVSPYPPKRSGIADYALRLVDALSPRYSIELVHEEGYIPEPGLDARRAHCVRARMFARRARVLGYRGILYQMGNSFYHGSIYDLLSETPGIVTLHDFNLAAFQFWKAHKEGAGLEDFRRELAHNYPDRPELLGPKLLDWATEPGGLQEACSRRQLHMNRRVFENAEAVIVHSPWCLEQVRRGMPEFAERTVVVRLGAQPVTIDPAERLATRARFGLPENALLFGGFGILTQGKMYDEAIRAFHAIADEFPGAMLVFVGADWENGQGAQVSRSLGRADRIRFFGRQPDADFEALVRAADIGVMLRRPPTYGETSAALLDVMRHGLPAIVTDVATFSDYPNDVVRKVRWESEGMDGLIAAMRELASNASRREALGSAAQAFVAANATWPHVAECYAEVIERVHDARCRANRAG